MLRRDAMSQSRRFAVKCCLLPGGANNSTDMTEMRYCCSVSVCVCLRGMSSPNNFGLCLAHRLQFVTFLRNEGVNGNRGRAAVFIGNKLRHSRNIHINFVYMNNLPHTCTCVSCVCLFGSVCVATLKLISNNFCHVNSVSFVLLSVHSVHFVCIRAHTQANAQHMHTHSHTHHYGRIHMWNMCLQNDAIFIVLFSPTHAQM